VRFNDHSDLEGAHSFLSPSTYSWVNYDDDRMREAYYNRREAVRGTRLHFFAKEAILLGQRLPRSSKTLNMYVNDAIGFRMTPELILFYSPYSFGTVDALGFEPYPLVSPMPPEREGKKGLLRIHDLKNGRERTSMMQCRCYAALFCLEYGFRPYELDYDLRIYQNDDVLIEDNPSIEVLTGIIDRIVSADRIFQTLAAGEAQ